MTGWGKNLFFVALLSLYCLPATAKDLASSQPLLIQLIHRIPARPATAMSGSEFTRFISGVEGTIRDQAVRAQLHLGNLPNFLRSLKPVQLVDHSDPENPITATIFVMPDYLAVGSDDDYVLVPMGLYAATEIAAEFGFLLPTTKMVDAIFEQSAFRLAPEPMPAGPQMRSTAYFWKHNRTIEEQRQSFHASLSAIISGHKKDVVLTNRLARMQGRVAIYGWHRPSGIPIQPLSTVHGAGYADYSHGIRLVSDVVLIDGKPCSMYSALQDPKLARLLSDEGTIPEVRQLMTSGHPSPAFETDLQSDVEAVAQ